MHSLRRIFPTVRWPGWASLALPIIAILVTPDNWPRWAFMWLLAFAIYCSCKALTWCAVATAGVPAWRQFAYLIAWPGLDADAFFHGGLTQRLLLPTAQEWIIAIFKTLVGAAVFWTARFWLDGTSSPILLGWAGMVGFVTMLHFGLFHVLSCTWRSAGVDAPPLMNAPLRSTSVAEFWSRRWNTAFRDLTHQFLFQPLARVLRPAAALVAAFFFSGLIHDAVISLPAGGGYGGPTGFFLLQAAAILAEKSRAGRAPRLGRGWSGWLFTALVLLLPARLLFHDRFVTVVVLPFMITLGAA